MIEKPFSQACENNKGPILEVLQRHLQLSGDLPALSSQTSVNSTTSANTYQLLEIGSGTGQHAAYLPQFFPHIHWQPSDVAEHLAGIRLWLADAAQPNVAEPLALDVRSHWPEQRFHALFSANTLHIMSQNSAAICIAQGAAHLHDGGLFLLYGPFNYGGQFTSASNARFNDWLQARDPASGIRDFEWVEAHMQQAGLSLLADHSMPANNRLLAFQKRL